MDIATTRKNRPKGPFFENWGYKKVNFTFLLSKLISQGWPRIIKKNLKKKYIGDVGPQIWVLVGWC